MRIRISTLLLLVDVLAEACLLLGRKLVLLRRRHARRADYVAGRGALRGILLAIVHGYPGGLALDIFAGLVGTAGAATLPVRSLVFRHDVLEGLLVEVAARLVLGRLVDALGASRRVRNHQVLLIAGARDLRLHAQVV